MKYNLPPYWEAKSLKEVIIFNPEEELKKGVVVKQVNLDKLSPNNKFINGFEAVEFTGKGSKFRNQDILVPQISSALLSGKTALVTILDKDEIGVGSNWYIVLRAIDQVTSPDYIYYLVKTPWFIEFAIKSFEGAHNQYINLDVLMEKKFPIPPYNEQCMIADTLSTIDAKIKKNAEICCTIDEILNRMFYDWFIDYNFPDEEGVPYKKRKGKFFSSELGPIPKGWKIGYLSDIGKIISGATPSKKIEDNYIANGISWITPKDISKLKTKFVSKGAIDITNKGLSSCGATLVPRGTVLFSSRAPIGYIAIAANQLATNQGFRSIVPFPGIGSTYIYYLLLNKTQEITNMASGSTFKEITSQLLKKFKIIIPDASVLLKFNEQTNCFMSYQENLEEENRLLVSIHDQLLPMLMLGIIEIPARS